MARTGEEYKLLLQSLLPKGRFWTKAVSSVLAQLLWGLGEEYSRVEERAEDLITEAHPRTSIELLTEWETEFGIPEEGQSLGATTEERQNEIYAKLIAVGQQDKGYFEDIAAALGYTVSVTENSPSWAGVVKAGEELGGDYVLFYWLIDISVLEGMKVNITTLINYITERKPGHTTVLFRFVGVGYNRGFGRGFDAIPWNDNSWWELEYGRGFDNGFTNAYDYDGVRLTGGFDRQFSIGFDSHRGGGFNFDEFGDGYKKPN